eukprot:412830-Pyramimonas_sp.AAC.1
MQNQRHCINNPSPSQHLSCKLTGSGITRGRRADGLGWRGKIDTFVLACKRALRATLCGGCCWECARARLLFWTSAARAR